MTINLALAAITATGANTKRTFADRFGDVKNVKDFGATGDGSTDDTTAIQNTINAAIDAGGGTVYFPAATVNYKVTAELTFQHGVPYSGHKLVKLRAGTLAPQL